MSDEPTTPRGVTEYIGRVLRRKAALLESLYEAELDAREKRREADKSEAHAFLKATGSIPARKYTVDVDPIVDQLREQADVAEVLVLHLRRTITHCGDEIDGARTAAATLRAEFSVLGMGPEEHG